MKERRPRPLSVGVALLLLLADAAGEWCGQSEVFGCDAEIRICAEEDFAVAKIPKKCTLLDLYEAKVGDAGAKALAKMLATHQVLKEINLYDNGIGPEGGVALADAIASNEKSKVRSLEIGGNSIGDAGAAALAGTLTAGHNQLATLSIYANGIGDKGTKAIAKALLRNTKLTVLSLYQNKITSSGAKALAQALEHNDVVQKLWLASNQIGDKGANAFAAMLKVNTVLEKIWLYDNNIGKSGALALAAALKVNTKLEELSLSNNPAPEKLRADIEALAAGPREPKPAPQPKGAACKAHADCASGDCRGSVCCGAGGKSDGCTSCDERGGCKACGGGYTLAEHACVVSAKPSGGKCKSDGRCASGSCKAGRCCDRGVNPGCAKCDEHGECNACKTGFTLTAKGKCAGSNAGAVCADDAECTEKDCRGGRCCGESGRVPGCIACDRHGDVKVCGGGYTLVFGDEFDTCELASAGEDRHTEL